MSYDTFIESTLANALLVFAYLAYKLCGRVVASKCHYTREHGLEIHLPDPEEPIDVGEINKMLQNRGMSMRLRNAA